AGEHGYIVVFIDDLDRCLPENAIEVMEALKVYLDRSDCVFVVGVEPTVLEEAIMLRYNDNSALSATDYLEKIVQVPIFVPRTRLKMGLALGERMFPDEMDRLVRHGTKRNPRRIKRFLNASGLASR